AAAGQQGQAARRIAHLRVQVESLGEAYGGGGEISEPFLDDGEGIVVPGVAALGAHRLGEIEPGGVEIAEGDGGRAALGPVGTASPRCAGCRHRVPTGSAGEAEADAETSARGTIARGRLSRLRPELCATGDA